MEEYKNTSEDSAPDIQAEKSDLSLGESNYSNLAQEELSATPPSGKKFDFSANKKAVLKFSLAGLVFLILGGVVYFGLDFYEKKIRTVALEKVLPKDSNGIIKVNINPDSNQFQLLESNMQKFPGYDILKKEFDEAGEGKTMTDLFFEKLKEKNLDFEADIKPAIGEEAYVVFPDMKPLFQNISREVVTLKNNLYAKAIDKNIIKDEDFSGGMVMGAEEEPLIPLDFIMASDIRDKKKALEVIEKLKNDEKYETETRKFKGYEYIRIKIKNVENPEEGSYLNYIETFHIVLGGNWFMTSKEDYLKEAVERCKKQGIIKGLFSGDSTGTLFEDESYKKVLAELRESDEQGMMFFYTKLNFEKIFKDNCQNGGSFCLDNKYLKYPEDIIYGFSLKMEEAGVKISSSSNQSSLGKEEIKNKSQADSLANKLPAKAGDAWLDVMVEHNNLKNFYYNFKKNNLTEESIKSLNDIRQEVKDTIGIDFESDLIDLISGSVGFSLFTSTERLPEGVILADLTDGDKMLETMKKMVEVFKIIQIEEAESLNSLYSQYDPNSFSSTRNVTVGENKEVQALVNKIKESRLEETNLPEGKIFVYKPVKSELMPLSEYSPELVFALKNNFMILGSSYYSVEAVLKGLSSENGERLAKGKYYSQAAEKFYPENYLTTYINMFGVWNIAKYAEKEFEEAMQNSYAAACRAQSQYPAGGTANINYRDYCSPQEAEKELESIREYFFGIGAIVRTLNIISYSEALGDQSKKQTIFIHLKELPKDEKEKAEKILYKLK
ncbi:MAG: DUF3352 domain-containing protein [Candidatus Moraniibacteriota bacterium]